MTKPFFPGVPDSDTDEAGNWLPGMEEYHRKYNHRYPGFVGLEAVTAPPEGTVEAQPEPEPEPEVEPEPEPVVEQEPGPEPIEKEAHEQEDEQ